MPRKINAVAAVIAKVNCLDLKPSVSSKIIVRNFFVALLKWIVIV